LIDISPKRNFQNKKIKKLKNNEKKAKNNDYNINICKNKAIVNKAKL